MCGVETEPFDAATWLGFVVEGFCLWMPTAGGKIDSERERERERVFVRIVSVVPFDNDIPMEE